MYTKISSSKDFKIQHTANNISLLKDYVHLDPLLRSPGDPCGIFILAAVPTCLQNMKILLQRAFQLFNMKTTITIVQQTNDATS